MTLLKASLVILLILFLIGRIRLGGMVEYSAQGLLVKVRMGAVWLQLYPRKQKAEKEKPLKKRKEKKPEKKTEKDMDQKAGGTLALVKCYLPLVGEAAGGMKKRITIDRLFIDFTAASQDAAGAAMAFGYANMAIGMLWPVFEQNFVVKDHGFHTNVDFEAQSPTVYLCAALSVRISQLASFAFRMFWCFLRLTFKAKREK